MDRLVRVFTRSVLCAAIAFVGVASALGAQMVPSARFLDVGSERERLLRVLQATGDVVPYPWSIRGFSPAEWDWLTPRTSRGLALLPPESETRTFAQMRVTWLPVETSAIYNSAFPYGFNDGPAWAGRGITGVISAGLAGRLGPLSFQLEPIAFDASNNGFELEPNGNASNPFLEARHAGTIDLPQRFGRSAYGRIDPGRSSVRLDLGPVAAELSTADQWWGPSLQSPLLLGNNAGGFFHAMIGSARPVGIWIGTLHARVAYGKLTQSAYAPATRLTSNRFMSGMIGVFMPRGVSGLELGAARFFHDPWPEGGWIDAPFWRPFEGILKRQLATPDNPTGNSDDNQLASIFFRWVFPRVGVDLYGEYGREDHNQDLRDFWQELDHNAGYVFGIQKTWITPNGAAVVARGELLNTRISHLQQGRGQAAWYVHTRLTQGHTLNGQAIGAAGAFGGGASTLAVDRMSANGRWTLQWNRMMRAEMIGPNGLPIPTGADVIHAFGIERAYYVRRMTYFGALNALWNFNRNADDDVFGVNLSIGLRRAF